MRVLIGFFVAALLLAVPLQSSGQEMTKEQVAKIEAEVLEWAEAWMDAWEDMETDCETAIGLWHPEHMAYFSRGERVFGQAWVDACHRSTANRASVDGSWTKTEVRVLSPDAAVFLGSYESTMGYIDDTPTRHWPTANQAILLERTATGWGMSFFANFNGPAETVEGG